MWWPQRGAQEHSLHLVHEPLTLHRASCASDLVQGSHAITISKSQPDQWHEHPLCQLGPQPTAEAPGQAPGRGCHTWHSSLHGDGKAR